MDRSKLLVAGALLLALGACAPSYNTGYGPRYSDTQRAAVGAVGGAILAEALDENVVAGAALGAGAGALCDDARICN